MCYDTPFQPSQVLLGLNNLMTGYFSGVCDNDDLVSLMLIISDKFLGRNVTKTLTPFTEMNFIKTSRITWILLPIQWTLLLNSVVKDLTLTADKANL